MKANLLTEAQMNSLASVLEGWEINLKKLKRTFYFKDFIEAFGFMAQVALISEAMNHHPELRNSYSTLSIELTTHDMGGVTNLDLELAKRINGIKKAKKVSN